jgi:ATP-dependent DNA ligase
MELYRRPPRRFGTRLETWAQVIERGYEGYVAKDEASAYEGGPTKRWLKGEAEELDTRRRPMATTDLRGRTDDDVVSSTSV